MSLLRNEPADRPTMAEARDRLAALARNEPTPPGILISPPLFNSGNAGRRPAGITDTPGRGLPGGGARPPWQRVEPKSPQPAVAQAAASAPMTPPKPIPAPTAAYVPPRASSQPPPPPPAPPRRPAQTAGRGGMDPDTKRKAVMFAGAGAAVVVIAVIVFLALNSGGGDSGNQQAAGTTPSTSATAGSSGSKQAPPASATPAGLGTTPSEKVTDFQSAGTFLLSFFNDVGKTDAWNMLTPAAQAVYGSEEEFASYWDQHEITNTKSAKADKGGANADGSIDMNLTLNDGPRPAFRIVKNGGQYLIDANTKVF
jgi:hypothetical protein